MSPANRARLAVPDDDADIPALLLRVNTVFQAASPMDAERALARLHAFRLQNNVIVATEYFATTSTNPRVDTTVDARAEIDRRVATGTWTAALAARVRLLLYDE